MYTQEVVGKVVFNNYPEHLKHRLKKGEIAVFALKDRFNPAIGKFVLRWAGIPSKDQIIDPESGDVINIAYKPKFNAKESEWDTEEIWLDPTANCQRTLHWNNANDQELYQYLKACNYNATNPNRDTSKEALIEEVIPEQQAKTKREKRLSVTDAVLTARAYSDEQISQFIQSNEREIIPFAKSNNLLHEITHIEGKRDIVELYAEKNPHKFISIQPSEVIPDQDKVADFVKSLAKREILTFDKDTSEWKLGQDTITKVSRKPNQQNRELAIYLTTSPKGGEWLKKLKEYEQ